MSEHAISPWFVYVLECRDGSFYTGITNDLEARIKAHQSGQGAKYTRERSPLCLVYQEPCKDKSSAAKREMTIKKLTRAQKEKLIKP